MRRRARMVVDVLQSRFARREAGKDLDDERRLVDPERQRPDLAAVIHDR
jgi:hypothetical protein